MKAVRRSRGHRVIVSRSRACGRALRRHLARLAATSTTRTAHAAIGATQATTSAGGDSLSFSAVTAGMPAGFLGDYFNGTDGIYCLSQPTFYPEDVYASCAQLALTDAQRGSVAPANNSASDAEYDACGNLVGGSSTFGWYTQGEPSGGLTSGTWVGGQDQVVPADVSVACAGTWTVVYSFTETFSDGVTLTANATGTFTVKPTQILAADETRGGGNPSELTCQACAGDPVNTASGDYWESITDLSIGGRGPGLEMTRTYSSTVAAAGQSSVVGAGWSFGYGMSLIADAGTGKVTVNESNGSRTAFEGYPQSDGTVAYISARRVLAELTRNTDGTYTYTVRKRTIYTFTSAGKLASIADLNGEKITLAYDTSGRLQTATDSAGRKLTFAYDAAGPLASVTDSAGRKVSYGHDTAGNLTTVTDVRGGVGRYGYNAAHLLLTQTDARGNTVTTNTYDAGGRTLSQTDALGRVTTFAYTGEPATSTLVTDPSGAATRYDYKNGILIAVTRAAGTADAATWTYGHDTAYTLGVTSITDPNGHTRQASYDTRGNLASSTTPGGRTTTFTYDSLNDVTAETDPNGVTTSSTYDAHGNLLTRSRPLSSTGQTQTTNYAYGSRTHPGDVTSITDPNGKVTTLTYTTAGDLASETDPLGNKTTYTYDTISRRLTEVSPRGNAKGATASQYTTTFVYDPASNLLSTTDPLGHTTSSTYDADGNTATVTDPKGHVTTYSYDAANQAIKTTRADGSALLSSYDADGNLAIQADAAGHLTSYTYDALGARTSVTDPLGRTTSYTHDAAGRLTSSTDPLGRTTTYSSDADDALTGISYSDGGMGSVSYGYDSDGQRTSMTDATGTTTYDYDSLGRLIHTVDGHGADTSFAYDLADNQTAITYPNGKTVTRTVDAANRVTSLTDWTGATTTFAYDADSDLTKTTFPAASKNVDTNTYNNAGDLTAITMAAGTTTLASLNYTRDPAGQVTAEAATGLPGANQSYSYDQLNRLTQATGKAYSYDAADNPTVLGDVIGMTYDAADQLTQSSAGSYRYDGVGERTGFTPTSGAASSYGYDQAGRLTAATTPAATIGYAYDGDDLRVAKTANGTTTNYAWDRSTGLPELLSDGSTSYLYGPDGHPIEQITSAGTTTYYHHDQLGSTRLLTSTSGTAVATFSYDPYGNQTGSTGTIMTPLGYAGEYRDADAGLIYLRARWYDPRTGQFISRDPVTQITRQPYLYAASDPIDAVDPSGLRPIDPPGGCPLANAKAKLPTKGKYPYNRGTKANQPTKRPRGQSETDSSGPFSFKKVLGTTVKVWSAVETTAVAAIGIGALVTAGAICEAASAGVATPACVAGISAGGAFLGGAGAFSAYHEWREIG